MGLLSWILAGAGAAVLAVVLTRLLGVRSPRRGLLWGLAAGLAGGLLATALRYGGLLELDFQSATTAFLAALLVLLTRALISGAPGRGGGRPRGG